MAIELLNYTNHKVFPNQTKPNQIKFCIVSQSIEFGTRIWPLKYGLYIQMKQRAYRLKTCMYSFNMILMEDNNKIETLRSINIKK